MAHKRSRKADGTAEWQPPYTFTQEDALNSITISFPVEPGITKKDLVISISKTTIQAGIRGQPPIVEGTFFLPVDDSLWQIDSSAVTIYLDKKSQHYWPLVISAPRDIADPRSMDPHSRYIIGRAFKQQTFEPEGMNADKAFKYIKDAAETGHAEAQFEMGRLYRDGDRRQGFIIEPDLEKAFSYFKLAADQGLVDAAFQIGLAYHQGSGVSKSIETALIWYGKCGEYAYAYFNMAIIFLEEKESYDPLRAREFFQKAVDLDPLMRKKIPRAMYEWEEAERKKREMKKNEASLDPALKRRQAEQLQPGDPGLAVVGRSNRHDWWNVAGVMAAISLVGAFTLHHVLASSQK